MGCESTDNLRNDFFGEIEEVADGGDGSVPGPKDGIAVKSSSAGAPDSDLER